MGLITHKIYVDGALVLSQESPQFTGRELLTEMIAKYPGQVVTATEDWRGYDPYTDKPLAPLNQNHKYAKGQRVTVASGKEYEIKAINDHGTTEPAYEIIQIRNGKHYGPVRQTVESRIKPIG